MHISSHHLSPLLFHDFVTGRHLSMDDWQLKLTWHMTWSKWQLEETGKRWKKCIDKAAEDIEEEERGKSRVRGLLWNHQTAETVCFSRLWRLCCVRADVSTTNTVRARWWKLFPRAAFAPAGCWSLCLLFKQSRLQCCSPTNTWRWANPDRRL